MENQWLTYAKQLQAIASTGLHFSESAFDRERFEAVATIAHQMLAELGNVPVSRILDLVPDFAGGYATPRVDVRGAVLDGEHVLLVREKTDGRWSLPGGYAEIGLTPAENVVKEVHEEAGILTRATALYSVRHKARQPYQPDVRDTYKLFFLCVADGDAQPAPGPETDDARFFHRNALPELSQGRVVPSDINAAFAWRDAGSVAILFD